jgi:exodeoxyribonuclease-1
METLYWHDYETFGLSPSKDRLAQFAGLRTDTDLNIIGKPLVKYCKLSKDIIPSPGACLVTGITPQIANEKGLTEAKFMTLIHKELSEKGTCSVGYNSSNFDDEFTRYALYRNFFNPYNHHDERQGNSRWDLINVVRLIRAINPDGPIKWPMKEDGSGKYSTRLEDLTRANGISHEDAHDALADVKATIAFARLMKQHFPKLYDYCYKHRTKTMASQLLGIEKKRLVSPMPLVHIDSFYGSESNYLAVVFPVAMHPVKGNAVIVFNVLKDPTPLLELTAREIRERLFTKGLGEDRISMHEINSNKCPVLVPLNKVSRAAAERLGIDKDLCLRRIKELTSKDDVTFVAQTAFHKSFAERTDPELMLYDGFFSRGDKKLLEKVQTTPSKELRKTTFDFEDARLPELLFRYRARNFPSTLLKAEQSRWDEYCKKRWHDEENGFLTLTQFHEQIKEALADKTLSSDKKKILKQLRAYVKDYR